MKKLLGDNPEVFFSKKEKEEQNPFNIWKSKRLAEIDASMPLPIPLRRFDTPDLKTYDETYANITWLKDLQG